MCERGKGDEWQQAQLRGSHESLHWRLRAEPQDGQYQVPVYQVPYLPYRYSELGPALLQSYLEVCVRVLAGRATWHERCVPHDVATRTSMDDRTAVHVDAVRGDAATASEC